MVTKKDIIIVIVSYIIGCIIGAFVAVYYRNKNNNKNNNNYISIDTTYNKVILDSIEYNIIEKDSIIYKLKQEMKYEIIESFKLNDSDAVVLFKQLSSE